MNVQIEFPDISPDTSIENLKSEIPKLVDAKIKLESALRRIQRSVRVYEELLKKEGLYENLTDFQELQDMVNKLEFPDPLP